MKELLEQFRQWLDTLTDGMNNETKRALLHELSAECMEQDKALDKPLQEEKEAEENQ